MTSQEKRIKFKMLKNDNIEMRFASDILPHGFQYVNMGKEDRTEWLAITDSLQAKVDRIGYKGSPRKYRATFFPIVEGVVKTNFPITTAETEVHVSDIESDVEAMARFLDYIGLDYKNCTMEPDFCDDAQAFVEEFVDKYQTHRVQ